jgi:hypothetical protein
MRSDPLENGPSIAVRDDELGRFCATMAEGLHALAQPLTILRSTVAASIAPSVTPAGQQRYLELSTQHVERTCSLFECLQELVIASQTEAECGPYELPELLAPVIEDQEAALRSSEIELRVTAPDALPPVRGDAARTLQALFAALKIAASVSSAGDVIELPVTARDGLVELNIQNKRIHGRRLNSSERLSLALAETNIRSQRGQYEWAEDPFRVSMALPLQGGDP